MIDTHVLDLADARAADTERAGVLDSDVVAALTEHGIFRRWVAAEWGGQASSVVQMLEEIEDLARADGATGWCVMIANTTALVSARLPPEVTLRSVVLVVPAPTSSKTPFSSATTSNHSSSSRESRGSIMKRLIRFMPAGPTNFGFTFATPQPATQQPHSMQRSPS